MEDGNSRWHPNVPIANPELCSKRRIKSSNRDIVFAVNEACTSLEAKKWKVSKKSLALMVARLVIISQSDMLQLEKFGLQSVAGKISRVLTWASSTVIVNPNRLRWRRKNKTRILILLLWKKMSSEKARRNAKQQKHSFLSLFSIRLFTSLMVKLPNEL